MAHNKKDGNYSCLYGTYKPYKKHKVWENDGCLVVNIPTAVLEDLSTGKV